MPTGCRSVYLIGGQRDGHNRHPDGKYQPASDLKSGAKDLGPYEFGHLDGC